VIFVGLDDTDTLDSPGTNQMARHLVHRLSVRFRPLLVLRHQLLEDPRVPCTSKNGSASIWLQPRLNEPVDFDGLFAELRDELRTRFVPGSDPGLALATESPTVIQQFGRRCQAEFVMQEEARQLAARCGIRLEGIGGTQGGEIGALAAIGLAGEGNDGRVVVQGEWPDDWTGTQPVSRLLERQIEIRCLQTGMTITTGVVNVGKKLRPNYRSGRIVLFVQPAADGESAWSWEAVKLK
jgi:hypothetical protein